MRSRFAGRSLLALAVVLWILGMTAAETLADPTCSGPGQPPCSCGFLCFDCDYQYLVHLNQCSDADGWPAGCGGEGKRPCTIFEHIPSCKTGLAEIPFPGGKCTRLDSDGFPPSCGGVDERACAVNEHIPSCKRGLVEERGVCRAIDADGFPSSCGGDGEPGCDLIVQTLLGITSCKRCHVEVPAVSGTCRAVKEDRYPAVCGGCWQPACDISTQAQIFEPACKPGLVEEGGVCKRLDAGGNPIGCADLGEPALATTVTPPAASPGAPIWGFADLHTHPFSNLAFGGLVLWGSPFDEDGIGSAVPRCDYACGVRAVEASGSPIVPASFPLPPGVPVHGPFGTLDLFGAAGSDDNALTHGVGGYPEFDGWPRNHRISHQQMYYRWIERAYLGGLRLMVTHAVNNEVLCRLSKRQHGFACEDMPTVDRQIEAIKDLEAFIDRRSGGPGRGWFRIATSSAQARRILEEGKLAVVLGIEVDSLFGCGLNGACTAEDLRREMARYHAMGVRHVFPVHLFDNAFGGTAIYADYFNVANKVLYDTYFDATDCSTEGVEFHLAGLPGDPLSLLVRKTAESVLGITLPVPSYPPGGHCNARGLTSLGQSLVKLLMGRKMVIDVDHMSYDATDRALEIALDEDYPVVAGHTRFQEAFVDSPGSEDHLKSEYAKLSRHVEAIRDLGGLVAPLLNQGEASAIRQAAQVASDCDNSTRTWAQAYLHAVEAMQGGAFHQAVAFGSDFNGGISQVGPRFGPEACQKHAHPDQGAGVTYPFAAHGIAGSFQMMTTGDRSFDFNQVGLAHIGLLPDFIQDLEVIGLTEAQLEPLFRSAEAYVSMWERIDAVDHFPPRTTLAADPVANAADWHRGPVEVLLSAAPHPDGWDVAEVQARAEGMQPISPFATPGSSVRLSLVVEGTTTLHFHAVDEAGNEEPETSETIRIDWTPPAVAWSAGPGSYRVDAFLGLTCAASDALSGIASSSCTNRNDAVYRFPLGSNTLTAAVADRAGNEASATVSFTVTVDFESLSNLVARIVAPGKTRTFLLNRLALAASAGDDLVKKRKQLTRFKNKVIAQTGRAVAAADAPILIALAGAL